MTLEGARQVHNRRLSRLECAKFAIARFQRLIRCLWQEFSHGLREFCTEGATAKEAGGTSSASSLAHFTKLRDGEYGRGLVQHPVTIRANSYEVA